MSVAVAIENEIHYTPEDLLSMPDGKNYELIDGPGLTHQISRGFEPVHSSR